jgi:hypothetical protein
MLRNVLSGYMEQNPLDKHCYPRPAHAAAIDPL